MAEPRTVFLKIGMESFPLRKRREIRTRAGTRREFQKDRPF
jgi:hypothetical protein